MATARPKNDPRENERMRQMPMSTILTTSQRLDSRGRSANS